MIHKYDFLIIGAGIAGMSYALKIAKAHKGRVCMICKTTLDEANTSFAQGGVASVTNLAVDDFDKHIKDTMVAGDYISDRKAVQSAAASIVTTTVPAEPLKPEIHSRPFQWSATYSLLCASVLGKMKAPSPSRSITWRSAAILSTILVIIYRVFG